MEAYMKPAQSTYPVSADSLDNSFVAWMELLKSRKQQASSRDYELKLHIGANEKEQFLLSVSVPLVSELNKTVVVITTIAEQQREYTHRSISFHASFSYQIA